MTLKLHITAKDIREGVRHDCKRCPIARALKRAAARAKIPIVFAYAGHTRLEIVVNGPSGTHRVTHRGESSEEVSKFMAAFDAWSPPSPKMITVELKELPKREEW